MGHDAGTLIPAACSPGFARVFTWYTRRLLSRSFHGVRVDRSSTAAARQAGADRRPLVLVLNHASWWDPLVALIACDVFMHARPGIAPIDAEQLRRFQFFRKIGLFGIDPDDPRSLQAMLKYVSEFFAKAPSGAIAITPQGRFTDVREPVRIRPGAAAIASMLAPNVQVLSLAIEYTFWQSKRPEVLLRVEQVPAPPARSTASWHRSIESTMQRNAEALARLAIARDDSAFEPLLAAAGSSVNPAYDWWLRMRGRSGEIAAHRGAGGKNMHAIAHSPSTGGVGGGSA